MTIAGNNLQHTSVSSERFIVSTSGSFEVSPDHFRFEAYSNSSIEALHKILRRLAGIDLPGKEYAEAYLRHLARQAIPITFCGSILKPHGISW
jgi:hypothetical protein